MFAFFPTSLHALGTRTYHSIPCICLGPRKMCNLGQVLGQWPLALGHAPLVLPDFSLGFQGMAGEDTSSPSKQNSESIRALCAPAHEHPAWDDWCGIATDAAVEPMLPPGQTCQKAGVILRKVTCPWLFSTLSSRILGMHLPPRLQVLIVLCVRDKPE